MNKRTMAEPGGFPWLSAILAISIVSLFFQLVPSAFWGLLSVAAVVAGYFDVRTWTWRSYAIICGIAIAVLIVAKGRQDNS